MWIKYCKPGSRTQIFYQNPVSQLLPELCVVLFSVTCRIFLWEGSISIFEAAEALSCQPVFAPRGPVSLIKAVVSHTYRWENLGLLQVCLHPLHWVMWPFLVLLQGLVLLPFLFLCTRASPPPSCLLLRCLLCGLCLQSCLFPLPLMYLVYHWWWSLKPLPFYHVDPLSEKLKN